MRQHVFKRADARDAMRVELTPAFVRDAKFIAPEAGKKVDRVIYWDHHRDSVKGFGLVVTKSGHRSFVYQYYAERQYRRMTLGDANKINLADARKLAKARQGDVAKGENPLDERRAAEAAAEEERRKAATAVTCTLQAIAEDYLTRECGLKRDADGKVMRDAKGNAVFEGGKIRSARLRFRAFERWIFPKAGKQQIDDIGRTEIAALLDGVEKDSEGGPSIAHSVLAYLSKLFNWYASRTDRFRSPIVRGMGRVKPKERAGKRILDDQEVRDLWAGLDAANKAGDLPSCYARFARTLLLTALRRTEAAKASWQEISYLRREDYQGDVLTVPAQRMKGNVDHAAPLTPVVLALIGERPKKDAKVRPFVFSTTNGVRPFSGFSKAKAALDRHINKLRKADGREPMPPWVLHDLRRTAKTLMQRAGVRPDISERVLAHAIPGVQGVYDRYGYLPEKGEALDKLAALVGDILKRIDW
jgi:integrase